MAWLRLIRSENVGPVTFFGLLERYGSAEKALSALPELALRGGRKRPLKIASKAAATKEISALKAIGAELVCWGEPAYPSALAAIADAPPVLSVRGTPHLLTRRSVAIVGARNASMNGRRFADSLARDLAAADVLVVSGLARGIDAAAHGGALEGGTAAVLAGGVDVIYPPEHASLYESICASGCIVAEQPPGTQPQARHFPRRNRLISGLSLAVVVVEAALRSGSLITARFALEQGREVMAVPGSPLDPRCKGTNNLIREGAALVEEADDVLRLLDSLVPPGRVSERRRNSYIPEKAMNFDPTSLEAARSAVLEALGPTPVPVDELLRQCQFSAPMVMTVLLELELAGRLERQPGNLVALLWEQEGCP